MEKIQFLALAAFAIFSVAPMAHATDSVNIMQIAVTGMSIPGTGGTYTSFSAPTTNRDVDLDVLLNPFFFQATSSNGNSGVYAYNTLSGTFTDLADTTMAAPTGGTFDGFSSLSSGIGAVGFIATDTNGTQGVYVEGYSSLSLIATSSTSPAAGITLGNIHNISIAGYPYGSPACDIESDAGSYLAIMNSDGSYTFYGGTNSYSFSDFGLISYKGSIGNSDIPGIYLEEEAFDATTQGIRSVYYSGPGSETNYLALASIGGSTPGSTGQFTSFGNPYVTANEVLFTAHYNTASGDQQGIFTYGPYEDVGDIFPTVQERVATGQVAPNSGGATFTGFSDISDTSFDESFIATLSNGGEGLYINVTDNPGYDSPSELIKVIETGDVLDGQIVQSIELAPDASNYYSGVYGSYYSNSGIGFEVNFTDGSEGVYYFTVNLPEPASLGLLALPAILMLRRR